MSISKQLKKSIAKSANVNPRNLHLEHPENPQHGDYSTNIAFILAKKQGKSPLELAKNIVKKLNSNRTIPAKLAKGKLAEDPRSWQKPSTGIKQYSNKVQAVKPGFINIFLKKEVLLKELETIIKQGGKYGQSKAQKQRIMVEFAHPNTHKLFHIGHLRNITNGEAIVRILQAVGNKTIRANYQGDVGLHIAKCLWSLCKSPEFTKTLTGVEKHVNPRNLHRNLHKKAKMLAKAYVQGNKAFKKSSKAKKEILEINKKIYSKEDKEIINLWKKTRKWSLDYFEQIYKRVYSHFDRYYFEGEVAQKGKELVLKGLEKGVFKKSKGAIIFPGSKYGLHDRVFVTKEGNPTYEGKDMELGRLQFEEYSPDLIIHNVGPEQKEYFQVIFKALEELFPHTKGKEYHLIYGWVRLKKGKMSSRLGNVITGDWLLDEAKKRIKKQFPKLDEKTAEQIAVGAVKYSFLKVSPPTDVVFDFQESINLQGNSGPYLQYTYARCKSVLDKVEVNTSNSKDNKTNQTWTQQFAIANQKIKVNEEEEQILRTIYKYPEVVEQAAKEYSPNLICNYLYDLAQKFNTFYNKHRILEDRRQKTENRKSNIEYQVSNISSQFRLALTNAVSQVLKNGLNLLAIKAPRKM